MPFYNIPTRHIFMQNSNRQRRNIGFLFLDRRNARTHNKDIEGNFCIYCEVYHIRRNGYGFQTN